MDDKRSAHLDNVKGALIILVIWAHLIEQAASNSPALAGVYGAVYLFHMPAFALVCGMVAQADFTKDTLHKVLRRLLLPLVVFQALYWPVLHSFRPGLTTDPFAPYWLLWFLLSLATWRLMLPVFIRLPFPVVTAFVLAVAAGFVDAIDHTLSLSRTLFFFPAYLLGHLYKDRLGTLSQIPAPLRLAVLATLVGVTGLLIASGTYVIHLYGSTPYSALAPAPFAPAALRILVILAGLTAALAFLSLIPRRAGPLTELGQASLTIYLLHGFVVLAFWSVTPSEMAPNPWMFFGLTGLLSLAIAYTLAKLDRVWTRGGIRKRVLG